jgi:hypothetical protein
LRPVALIAALAALLGAGLGAAAIIYVSRRQMKFERAERLSNRQLAAADDFIKAVTTAMRVMIENPPSEVDPEGRVEVLKAGTDLAATVHRIDILFGTDSAPAAAALEPHLFLSKIASGGSP